MIETFGQHQDAGDVGYWHEADIPRCLLFVPLGGKPDMIRAGL
jgi:hypothetical protein